MATVLAEDLGYVYRRGDARRPALEGLSFSVERGEIVGLLGPNGAGKTTAIKILSTILRPGAGRAEVAGFDVVADPLAVRRSIAAVLQESAVETMLPAWDNLVLYGRLRGMDRGEAETRARRAAELLELERCLRQRAMTLSGGMKRRLQVAKALMVDTPVLFLDEATTAMDPLIKRRTIEALREQARGGRAVVLTTHLLDEAEELCDRMIFIRAGRAVAGGTLAELRKLAKHRFHIELQFHDGSHEEGIAALRALTPLQLEARGAEVSMVVQGSEGEWIRSMARISEQCPFGRLEIRGVSLEEVFLEVFGDEGSPP